METPRKQLWNIISSKANDNVVYEDEYQDTEAAISGGFSSNLLSTNVDEGGSSEEFSNENVTCEDKFKDIEEDMPIDLEENNSALQLLLWDNLVVNDGDVNMPSLELHWKQLLVVAYVSCYSYHIWPSYKLLEIIISVKLTSVFYLLTLKNHHAKSIRKIYGQYLYWITYFSPSVICFAFIIKFTWYLFNASYNSRYWNGTVCNFRKQCRVGAVNIYKSDKMV